MGNTTDYKAAYERQKLARARAEDILENKSRELYEINESLVQAYNELKNNEAQLLHQEKLASIGQLSAGVAHEINNPTSFIKSNINTLGQYWKNIKELLSIYDNCFSTLSRTNALAEENISTINNAKKRLDVAYLTEDVEDLITESLSGILRIEDIVQSLKNFARPDSLLKERFNVNECIKNTIKLISSEIKYKVELQTNLTQVPDTFGSAGEINQVILNLLVNASHAIEERGTISISSESDEEHIFLKVTDNGSGIKEEHLSEIFNPFFSTKETEGGTGLGLSITHGIVQKHRGQITVDSKKNTGTTFTVMLPILEGPVTQGA